MRVEPISSAQPQFRARLTKGQIQDVLRESTEAVKCQGIDSANIVPKLYTLLELLDKHPGRKAEVSSKTHTSKYPAMGVYPEWTISTLEVDGNEIEKDKNGLFNLLYKALTSHKTSDGRTITMPLSIFDGMWWANRDKTEKDLMKFEYIDTDALKDRLTKISNN